jgi:hypothetical protein
VRGKEERQEEEVRGKEERQEEEVRRRSAEGAGRWGGMQQGA